MTACRIRYKPNSKHKRTDASRQVGAVELTPSPTAAANVTRMRESAVAASAPAITGVHCRYLGSASSGPVTSFSASMIRPLSQAEKRQHSQNDHHQTDEINQTVHCTVLHAPAQLYSPGAR